MKLDKNEATYEKILHREEIILWLVVVQTVCTVATTVKDMGY
ncbi:hypothetical protein [Bombella intestini]|nr:hypothetical protein [Bombella intestini]